jgi:hypothetical protein
MHNFEGIKLSGKVRLTSKGYWMDEEKQIWVNEGRLVNNDQLVRVFLFNPELASEVIEKKVVAIELQQKRKKAYFAAETINKTIVPYAVFEVSKPQPEKPISPTSLPRTLGGETRPRQKTRRRDVPAWLFASMLSVAIALFLLVAGMLAMPTVMSALRTPTSTPTLTPTPTRTPTPQVFTFRGETTVENFVTGESFAIPKGSRVVIVNPAYAACDVLANWNGTQIVIPAKLMFPERNCP